ncbi:pyridoxal phosphate homeostasis protein-like isoform X1 [Abrus precatorius]|uniref:Pyridoxal phosphate homeostasis protein n=1 Tax=Abrus precatorius TaxID=3816 RepID=A0A8B8JF28_ABRPR|nr:pyridoxal phosphate homeostasis protein-like isoform X1 [Abrus precatorius]
MASSTAVETGGAATPLKSVLHRVQQAAERSGRNVEEIRVVAASKTKSISALRQVYDAGHRCFGENYVKELLQKAPQQLPDDIEWHLIGNLQSNKVKPLIAGVPNLAYVESVDDEKIANLLDLAVEKVGRKPLKVFVQVNTSGETSKFGVEPAQCVDLVKHITNCPNLEFCGLMTIGMLDYTSTPENFKTLSNCRSEVCKALGIPETQCELSMGMTADFEQAIKMGSTTVRIGTAIFGPRE